MATKKKGDALRQAGENMSSFLTGVQEHAQDASEGETEEKSINTEKSSEKASEGSQRVNKKVFSFRAPEDKVMSWRAYAEAKGMKVDDLGESALQEYTDKHSLTGDQKEVYEKISELRSLKRGISD